MEHEVCVFGAGPAGLAVAARLLEHERDVRVLDRPARAKAWGGESLSGTYLAGLVRHYAIERRWPSAPFWRRRHRLASA